MKQWPLKWKIAIYAAILGVIATIAGAGTTWFLMRRSEIRTFDRRLTLDAQELFRDIENFGNGWASNERAIKEIFVPLALQNRFIEIRAANGELLYASPNLHGALLEDGIAEIHSRKIENHPIRVGTFYERGLTLFVGADLKETNQIGRDILFGMLGALPTVLLVVIIGGHWVAGRAVAPVDNIREAAERITAQNLDQRLPVPPTHDEIAGLIRVLNATFDRLQRSFEQSVRFSAEASHHLKTPLAVLRAGIEEMLIDSTTTAQQQDRLAALLHQLHQLTSISENLLLLARADAGRLQLSCEQFDLREVLDGVCDDARALAEPNGLTVQAALPNQLLFVGDRSSVALILQNLVENGIKYNESGGLICIDVQRKDGSVEVTVRNNGVPIPADRAQHIFDRFYRARPDARIPGSGLGLSIARELARAQGGELELKRSDMKWTEFSLRLPLRPNKN
jgi:signal transduction histidine kinase